MYQMEPLSLQDQAALGWTLGVALMLGFLAVGIGPLLFKALGWFLDLFLGPLEKLLGLLSRRVSAPAWWRRWKGLRRSPESLRRDWELSKLQDRVVQKSLEQADQAAEVLARRQYSSDPDPLKSLEYLLLQPRGMLRGRRLAEMLRRKVQEQAYLKKVLPQDPQ